MITVVYRHVDMVEQESSPTPITAKDPLSSLVEPAFDDRRVAGKILVSLTHESLMKSPCLEPTVFRKDVYARSCFEEHQ